MTKSLKEYQSKIREMLDSKKARDWVKVKNIHLEEIGFYQHERLIHLWVTLFCGLIFFLSVSFTLMIPNYIFLAVDAIFLVLVTTYIVHYFKLENGVQRLYKLNREIEGKFNTFK